MKIIQAENEWIWNEWVNFWGDVLSGINENFKEEKKKKKITKYLEHKNWKFLKVI